MRKPRCGISKAGRCVFVKGDRRGRERTNNGLNVCELSENLRCQLSEAGKQLNAVQRRNLADRQQAIGVNLSTGDNVANLVNLSTLIGRQPRRRRRRVVYDESSDEEYSDDEPVQPHTGRIIGNE